VNRLRLFALGLLLVVPQSALAQGREWRSVEEYGLRAAFPPGMRLCEAMTGGSHLHGWAMPLQGDCDQMRRRVTIWADWNASFEKSPEHPTYCSSGEGGSLVAGARLHLSFPDRRSATCRYDQAAGAVTIVVMTQAWRWPEWRTATDPDLQAPLVNYSAILRSAASTLEADLRTFRSVLRSVRLTHPHVRRAEGGRP
jgi:hypothetical protein